MHARNRVVQVRRREASQALLTPAGGADTKTGLDDRLFCILIVSEKPSE